MSQQATSQSGMSHTNLGNHAGRSVHNDTTIGHVTVSCVTLKSCHSEPHHSESCHTQTSKTMPVVVFITTDDTRPCGCPPFYTQKQKSSFHIVNLVNLLASWLARMFLRTKKKRKKGKNSNDTRRFDCSLLCTPKKIKKNSSINWVNLAASWVASWKYFYEERKQFGQHVAIRLSSLLNPPKILVILHGEFMSELTAANLFCGNRKRIRWHEAVLPFVLISKKEIVIVQKEIVISQKEIVILHHAFSSELTLDFWKYFMENSFSHTICGRAAVLSHLYSKNKNLDFM